MIDSLLFVFGFRASKMRQGKVSALIHYSSNHPNLPSCMVEIHFHNVLDQPDGTSEKVPGTSLVVSRKAFKNNSSKYYINDKDSSYTEVTTLMREKGIDLDHKRFLILQGEVESIAQMKPKADNDNDDGLLEYLEDIIGTSEYKKGIEDSTIKLEEMSEECIAKLDRLDVVRNEMSGLEKEKNKIVDFMKMENTLVSKKSVYFQAKIATLRKLIEINKETIEQERNRLEKEREETQGHKEKLCILENDIQNHTKELEAMKQEIQTFTKSLTKAEISKVRLEEKSKHLATKQKKLEKSLSSAKHGFNEAQSWIQNYDDEVKDLTSRSAELEQSLNSKSSELLKVQNNLKGKTQSITDQIEATKKKLDPWREKIAAKESEIAVVQSEIDLLREKQVIVRENLKSLKSGMEEIMKIGQSKEQEMVQAREELAHVREQIDLGNAECQQVSNALMKMKQQRDYVRQQVQTARTFFTEAQLQGKVLASLTKLRNSGRVDNFHGRLGSLGSIDPKYDVAISTACPALDNLVVDTVEAGQHCIEYLRKNNIGRAKFILLDRLPKRNLGQISTPENVPRLFDLITFKKEKFASAFYSVLNDTLVANDSEQARRIAYGGRPWRVVSLQGLLIDKSGTMSGGGKVMRGKMKGHVETSVSDKELKELEEELEQRELNFMRAETTLSRMEKQLSDLEDCQPKLELNISKLNLEIETLSTSLEESQKQYKETSRDFKQSIPKEEEIHKVEEKKGCLENEHEQLKQHSAGLEKSIAMLQDKIMEIGGVELRFIKSQVDGIVEQREIINAQLSRGVLEKAKKENEIKRYSRIIENVQVEMEGLYGNALLDQELEEKENAVRKLEQNINQCQAALNEKETTVLELKNDIYERRSAINSILSAEIELSNSIEESEKAHCDNTSALQSYSSQIGELKLHTIGDLGNLIISKAGDEEMEESSDITELPEYSLQDLDAIDMFELKAEISSLNEATKNANIDMHILKEYRRRASDYIERRDHLNSSIEARDQMKQHCESLQKKRLDEFMEGFNMISMKLKEMYQMITMGGNAELELVDSLDPFSEGIIFSVMPPKKSWKNISNLSGGEKTLSSLALVFALHHYKPTPLYVMDEIDAALDFRNVSIVANYIRERTKNGQFIVISLRNNMFELANQLVGIYKVNSMTKSISLQNKDYLRLNDPPITSESSS